MLECFHRYLYGQKLHLHTDHSTLTWLINFKDPEEQMAHWVQCPQQEATYDQLHVRSHERVA
jgi:hypothetical protein